LAFTPAQGKARRLRRSLAFARWRRCRRPQQTDQQISQQMNCPNRPKP
jgi:hypothetical protein